MIDIIRDIEISSVDDALNILKSIDTDGNLFEKAHNVGDLDRLATVHPSEDIKMVLYSNVDTAGY